MLKAIQKRKSLYVLGLLLISLLISGCAGQPGLEAPGLTLSLDPAGEPEQVSSGVQLLLLITVLSLAPGILLLTTSFTRIVIVLSLLRNAIGTPSAPPSQVIIGLSLLLTFFVMSPVYAQVQDQALDPYLEQEIDQQTAFERAAAPVRDFMFQETRGKDLELFLAISGQEQPEALEEIPNTVLMPAFVISELRTAFIMGFVLYIPFLIVDMVISSVLLSLGMMMLPPSLVSLPFKVLLFVMVDGWHLIARSLLLSFQG
jgi:flagellar biosynthetic protein FliP